MHFSYFPQTGLVLTPEQERQPVLKFVQEAVEKAAPTEQLKAGLCAALYSMESSAVYCTVLYCIVLYCIVLYYNMSYYIILYHIMLYYIILYHIMLYSLFLCRFGEKYDCKRLLHGSI